MRRTTVATTRTFVLPTDDWASQRFDLGAKTMGESNGKKIPKWKERGGERERVRELTQSKLDDVRPAEAELKGKGGRQGLF